MFYRTWLCPPPGECGSHFCRTLLQVRVQRVLPRPDQGTSTYAYDAQGELRTQTDTRNVLTTVTGQDTLGRMTARTIVPSSAATRLPPLTFSAIAALAWRPISDGD